MVEKLVAMRSSLTKEQAEDLVADLSRAAGKVSREDWQRAREVARANLAEMTDEEDRAITENALADPDNPPLEDEFFERCQRRMGRPPLENPKEKVTIRLDTDLVERLRAGGRGWQTRANAMLRKAMGLT
jgi:uncharacterized protein (DUF4415 family)